MRLSTFYNLVQRATQEGDLKWSFAAGAIRSIQRFREGPGRSQIVALCPITAVWRMRSGESVDFTLAARKLGLTDDQRALISGAADCPMRFLSSEEQEVRRKILAAIGR